MDVRCEKCSTEYELDESRLKPGGVTVKCTHCGHTFKVRKREAAPAEVPGTVMGMPRGPSPATPAPPAPAPAAPASSAAASGAANASAANDRQWLIRLENGETRSCRELATLQEWIVAGEVTRDALISRSGKTWKLLGDIVELGMYFTIADEAKQHRARRESARTSGLSGAPANKKAQSSGVEEPARHTLVGVGAVSSGAMPLSDLDNEEPSDNDPTTARRLAPRTAPQRPLTDEARPTVPRAAAAEPSAAKPPARKANPSGPSPQAPAAPPAPAAAPAILSSAPANPMPAGWPAAAPAAPLSPAQPAHSAPNVPTPAQLANVASTGASGPMSGMPGPRDSLPWTGVGPGAAAPEAAGPSGPIDGPMGGRLRQTGDEPAFAGGNRGPRTPLASSQPFTGVARDSQPGTSGLAGRGFGPDDDAGPAVAPRGSRAGLWIAIASLVVIAGGFAVVWLLVLKQPAKSAAVDAGVSDAATAETPATMPDAGATAPQIPEAKGAVAAADEPGAAELGANVEARMRAAVSALADSASKDEASTLAMRARLLTAIAQSLEDRAALLPSSEASAADKLRKKSKETVLEALPLAQRAFKAAPNEASANLAMADLLRLQGKSSRDLRRYLDVVAKAQPGSVDQAILEGLLLVKEGKLGDARALWSKADAGEAKLEQSGDVRLRFRSAVAALADGKAVDARNAVDTVMAAQPEHEAAKALLGRLDQAVASDDPLPPEEPGNAGSGSGSGSGSTSGGTGISAGDSYDKLVKKGDELAEKNCRKAIPVYQAALDKQPTGVSALIGMGFCHIEIQEYASANSRFRTVLALQAKNERALWGIAELYRQQGAKAKAIEAFRAYLEAYPNSAAAKRQLEMLDVPSDSGAKPSGGEGSAKPSGGDSGSSGGDSGSKPTTAPETTPTPTPAAPDPAPATPAQ